MVYTFLSKKFFEDHPQGAFPEMETKQNRPYVLVVVNLRGCRWGLPMRSNIKHNTCFWTDKANRCGVDYTKAVLLDDERYLDKASRPYVRSHERQRLTGKEAVLANQFERYVHNYKQDFLSGKRQHSPASRFSTLQYYHKEIGL